MKKHLTIIALFVILVCIFVSCTNDGSSSAPTPMNDTITRNNIESGESQATKIVDEFALATNAGSNTPDAPQTNVKSTHNGVDNEIPFDATANGSLSSSTHTNDATTQNINGSSRKPTHTNDATINTTTTTEPVTDSDGWINRWY